MNNHKTYISMYKPLLFLLCSFICLYSHAQVNPGNVVKITLPEAIELAKRQSPVGKSVSLLGESNYWMYRAARAGRYPQLYGEGSVPGINRSILAINLPDGTQKFIPQSL